MATENGTEMFGQCVMDFHYGREGESAGSDVTNLGCCSSIDDDHDDTDIETLHGIFDRDSGTAAVRKCSCSLQS